MVLVRSAHGLSTSALVQRLDEESVWRVREAQNGDAIKPGCVLVAPEHAQLGVVLEAGTPHITLGKALPSIDTFFESVAQASGGSGALGVLLLTPNEMGSRGLRSLRHAGGYTIAQIDPASDTQRTSHRTTDSDAAIERVPFNELPQTIAAYCASRSIHGLKPAQLRRP
jgi:two-component system chemotaxis response regulator CheB